MTVGELAEQLLIRHHSAVGLIDRLIAQRLVQREQDQHDPRQVCISLTEEGNKLLANLALAHRKELR